MNDPSLRNIPRPSQPLWSVLDRMIGFELLKTLIAVLGVLVVIIVSRMFLGILTQAIQGDVASETVFSLLGLKTLIATAILLPPAAFMAVLTVMGRMYRDHEMSVLASAGVGYLRIYRAMAWILVPIFALSVFMALEVMPWSERKSQALISQDIKTHDIRGIKPGQFNEFSSGNVVLYAEEMDEGQNMHKIFVQSSKPNHTTVVLADAGRLHRAENGDHFVVLNNGRHYDGKPGDPAYTISEFDEYGVRISGPDEVSDTVKREATPSLDLLKGSTPRELAELQKRLGIPLGVIALAVLAVPLARVAPRQGPFGSLFTAFIIYVVYENVQKISQGLLISEKLPAWTAYVLIYGLLGLMTLGLFLNNLGSRWIRYHMRGQRTHDRPA